MRLIQITLLCILWLSLGIEAFQSPSLVSSPRFSTIVDRNPSLIQSSFPLQTYGSTMEQTKQRYQVNEKWKEVASSFTKLSISFHQQFKSCVKKGWYCLPLLLCLVPVISKACFNMDATTPECWKMVEMGYVHQSPDAPLVLGFFLGSNIFYFLTGIYLLIRHPPMRARIGKLAALSLVPTKRTGLGLWIVASGIISTIFHSFQALGDTLIAEGLCYMDHGIACSSILYFWKHCGKPKLRVWVLGIAGLIALSLPIQPGYAFLHSSWHFLSAATAFVWSRQVE